MDPVLRAEDVTGRVANTPADIVRYAIYADDVEIAGLIGAPGTLTLVFRGNTNRDVFLPENLVELIRIAGPAKANKWSDRKIIRRATGTARVGLRGRHVVDFNLEELRIRAFRPPKPKHLDNSYAYRLALNMNTALVVEVNVVLDDVSTTFRYFPYTSSDLRDRQGTPVVAATAALRSPSGADHPHRHLRRLGQAGKLRITAEPRECLGVQLRRHDRRYRVGAAEHNWPCESYGHSGARGGRINQGIYTVERTTAGMWSPDIISYLKRHHSNSAVRSMDTVALASCIAGVARVISTQLTAVQAQQLR